jgi:hypothetical protein
VTGSASANVLTFAPRSAVGDWTAAELDRLQDIVRTLEAQGATVHAAFGLSDAGDPWCVVANDADEMLLHVARIGGRIVVHDAVADVVRTGSTLWSAFDPIPGGAREGRSETAVVPLHGSQTLATLAVALLLEQALRDRPQPIAPSAPGALAPPAKANDGGIAGAAETHANDGRGERPSDHPAARVSGESAAEVHAGGGGQPSGAPAAATVGPGLATAQAVSEDAAATAHAFENSHGLPSHAAAAGAVSWTMSLAERAPADASSTHARAGASSDGPVDLRTATATDDHVTLGPRAVALGGADHTVFVVTVAAPSASLSQTEHPLSVDNAVVAAVADPSHPGGIVLNFTAQDEIKFANSAKGEIISVVAVADVLAGLHSAPALQGFAVTPGVEVGFAQDGDKVADVYLMVAGPGVGALHVGQVSATGVGDPAASIDSAVPLIGHTLHGTDFLFG